jgi:hypothetical protein
MTCTGQHPPPCADCAIARCRARAPRLKVSCQARGWWDFWRVLGVVMSMVRTRLRRRWMALPVEARRWGKDIAVQLADDLVGLEEFIGELEQRRLAA